MLWQENLYPFVLIHYTMKINEVDRANKTAGIDSKAVVFQSSSGTL